jgi:hypothetical protein
MFGKQIDIAYNAWCDCIAGDPTKQYLRTSADGGKTWTSALITPAGYAPQLRLNSHGHPLDAYGDYHGVGYAVGATTTGSFTHSSTTNTTGFVDGEPQLAVGANDRAQIVYDHYDIDTISDSLRYERQTAGGWSSPDPIAPLNGSFAFDVDSNSQPHVVLAAKNGIHQFTLAGGNWVNTTIVAGVKDAGPVVVRGLANGKIEVAYLRASGGLWVTKG